MTWQADAASDWAVRQVTWQYDRGGVAVDVAGTWANHRLTRVMFWLVGKGATWPSQGLPRGTPLLVIGFICKIGLAWPGVEPATSGWAKGLAKLG
jgi:hypothetical protein